MQAKNEPLNYLLYNWSSQLQIANKKTNKLIPIKCCERNAPDVEHVVAPLQSLFSQFPLELMECEFALFEPKNGKLDQFSINPSS